MHIFDFYEAHTADAPAIWNPPPIQPRTLKVNTLSTMCRMPVTKTDVRRHPPCSCCIGRGRGMFQAAGYCGAPIPYAGWRDGYAGLACCIVSLNNHRQVEEFWSIKLIIWSLALLWSCDNSPLQRQTLGQVLGAGILPWAWTWEALLQSRLYKLLMIAKTHALPWRRVFVFHLWTDSFETLKKLFRHIRSRRWNRFCESSAWFKSQFDPIVDSRDSIFQYRAQYKGISLILIWVCW